MVLLLRLEAGSRGGVVLKYVCHVTSDTKGLECRLRLGKFKIRNQRQENSRSNAEFIQHSTLSLRSPITLGQKESIKMRLRDLLFKFNTTSL